ncbi:MAG: LON peptidase substrate-binding domain-containing protein [Gammaproteobacteria bacterium]
MMDTAPAGTLALFPLHTVLFPGGLLPLQIFEPRYVDLVRACLGGRRSFGIVGIREGREAGTAAIPFDTGTHAEIVDWRQGDNGLLNILVRGSRRFRILAQRIAPDQLITAEVAWLDPPAARATDEEFDELKALLHKLLEHHDAIDRFDLLTGATRAEVAYRVAELLPLSTMDKTTLLAMPDDRDLLHAVRAALEQLLGARPSLH